MQKILLVLFLSLVHRTSAQAQVPSTDIYLSQISLEKGAVRVLSVANITNREGYDNQPSFTPDGENILLTSIREDGQADIYRYNIRTATMSRAIQSRESEYSPAITPDGKTISVVSVELDSTQRLWQFDLNGMNARVILPEIKPVGYYAWADEQTVALFVLGSPPTLQLANITTGKADIIEKAIGRSLHKIPGQNAISFVHKVSDSVWWIKRLDIASRTVSAITTTLSQSEDYCWLPDGSFLMGQGTKLFHWKPQGTWNEVGDLSRYGIENITRLAVNNAGTHLAIVDVPSGEKK